MTFIGMVVEAKLFTGMFLECSGILRIPDDHQPVSYTHLTLPTILLV